MVTIKRLPLLAALLLASAASAKADPVVLFTFDDLTPGNAVVRWRPSGSVEISSFISSGGSRFFSTSLVRVVQTGQAASPPNAIFSLNGPLPSTNVVLGIYDSLQVNFIGPHFPSHCQPCTDFVSFNVVGTAPGQTEPWRVVFYGAGGELFSVTGVTDQFVSFSSPVRNINFVRLFTTNGGREGIDNLAFNSPIPEPATVLTLGAGLIGAAAAARRRRRARR